MDDLEGIREQVRVCTDCSLSETRTHAVPGEGPSNANVVLIGEGPGYHEDQQGKPFVGSAGKFLDNLLASAGFSRDDVFITNMVKCRPPNNRDPQNDEIESCSSYLDSQIEALSPKVIVTLGRFSFGKFFPGETITQSRGIVRKWNNINILPMYHPAAALYNPSLRPRLEKDFEKLLELINPPKNVAQYPTDESGIVKERQLGLFD